MKLYRMRIPDVARDVIKTLCENGDIEVELSNREEAEQDLVSIMEEYLRRHNDLRAHVKEEMHQEGLGYDKYGRVFNRTAEEWNHPLGDDVEKYLARQFIENFMISRWVEEVYEEDGKLWRKTLDIIRRWDVDEQALRDEAAGQIKNLKQGTVDYEMAFERALRDVKRKHGLIRDVKAHGAR
ncbi:MAG: DUF507 family protein [Alphaproteobacteria bacterium]|nr:DUF507 family protein [Alphaproteobacteria bacterium]